MTYNPHVCVVFGEQTRSFSDLTRLSEPAMLSSPRTLHYSPSLSVSVKKLVSLGSYGVDKFHVAQNAANHYYFTVLSSENYAAGFLSI